MLRSDSHKIPEISLAGFRLSKIFCWLRIFENLPRILEIPQCFKRSSCSKNFSGNFITDHQSSSNIPKNKQNECVVALGLISRVLWIVRSVVCRPPYALTLGIGEFLLNAESPLRKVHSGGVFPKWKMYITLLFQLKVEYIHVHRILEHPAKQPFLDEWCLFFSIVTSGKPFRASLSYFHNQMKLVDLHLLPFLHQ